MPDLLVERLRKQPQHFHVPGADRPVPFVAVQRRLMVEATSSLVSDVERITRSGSRTETPDGHWTAAVHIGARVTVTPAGPMTYHDPDGNPPPTLWTDGELIIEGDHGLIYLYGIAGAFGGENGTIDTSQITPPT